MGWNEQDPERAGAEQEGERVREKKGKNKKLNNNNNNKYIEITQGGERLL